MIDCKDMDDVQVKIRNFDVKDLNITVVEMMENMIMKMGSNFSEQEIMTFNNLLNKMFESIQNVDYQLLDDLIEFELKPFWMNIKTQKELY